MSVPKSEVFWIAWCAICGPFGVETTKRLVHQRDSCCGNDPIVPRSGRPRHAVTYHRARLEKGTP